jgi:hypothetical protein
MRYRMFKVHHRFRCGDSCMSVNVSIPHQELAALRLAILGLLQIRMTCQTVKHRLETFVDSLDEDIKQLEASDGPRSEAMAAD